MSVGNRRALTALIALTAMFVAPNFLNAQDVTRPTDAQTNNDALHVWSSKQNKSISEQALLEALENAPLIILGEVHDNPAHHRLRARLVSKLMDGRANASPTAAPTSAVFEHATTDRQENFSSLNAQASRGTVDDAKLAAFFDAANWKKRGWPASDIFAPLIKAVLRAGMPIYAGDVPRALIMGVARGSSSSHSDLLTDQERARLGLDRSLGPEVDNAARSEIKDAHCGVLPDAMLTPMAKAQRLRDATLADVMVKAADLHGSAILFAGNGHARTDRGVPWYLRARQSKPVISVMFKERRAGASEGPAQQTATPAVSPGSQDPVADYVVWTSRHERPDPCLKMREKYGKTKR